MKRDMTLKRKWLAAMLVAAALSFSVGQQAMAQTKQAVVVGSSVTAVKDGTADAVSTSGKTYVETTSGNTVTITTAAPPAGKVTKVTVKSYAVTSAEKAKVRVTALTVTGTGGATDVSKGSTLQMTATAAPTYADWQAVTWSVASDTQSGNPGNATIDASTGVLTGTAEGDVVVTATATDVSGVTGRCTVTVVKPIPAGAIRGKFTINAGGEQVYFSQGNLQATTTDNGANWSWGFATNQWDLIGNEAANKAISGNGTVSENGTVDLFGWSTDATTYGINNSTNGSDYSGEFVDWGTLAITNGGNTENSGWRTLSKDEWDYLFSSRTSGGKINDLSGATNVLYTHATINTDNESDGINGIILFPDGVTINYSDATHWGGINQYSNWYGATKCTTSQWNALAAKGFVFLPTGGVRNGTTVSSPYENGYYWSSYTSSSTSTYAYYTRVVSAVEPTTASDSRKCGFAVRLVKNVVGSISYTTTSMVKKPGDGAFTNPLTNTGDGSVTYARSDGDNICTVNATTGEVTLNGTLGTCTITATVVDGSIYTYALHTVSYTLTVKEPFPVGDGMFSVSSTQKVYFAKGNLQATYYDENYSDETPGTWSWAFATNQWEYIGGKDEEGNGTETGNNFINGNGKLSKNGTVDLFGWSTGVTYYGIHNSKTGNDYSGDFVDWGNIIGPGSGWRTLTIDEWTWLLGLFNPSDQNPGTNCRTSSTIGETGNARFAKAYLFGTHGLIIFPDSYTHPEGVAYPTGINQTDDTSWNANTYNATDWGKMEAAGCVFLPFAGRRSGTNIRYVGYYWSATPEGTDAYLMQFGEGTGDTGTNAYTLRYMGNVVRLVKNAN